MVLANVPDFSFFQMVKSVCVVVVIISLSC